jgi:hypothetical protein
MDVSPIVLVERRCGGAPGAANSLRLGNFLGKAVSVRRSMRDALLHK